MVLMTLLQEKHADFADLCQSHKVIKIDAFSSSITNRFDPKTSNIDLVVTLDFEEPTSLKNKGHKHLLGYPIKKNALLLARHFNSNLNTFDSFTFLIYPIPPLLLLRAGGLFPTRLFHRCLGLAQ
jgi:hypothetical protein